MTLRMYISNADDEKPRRTRAILDLDFEGCDTHDNREAMRAATESYFAEEWGCRVLASLEPEEPTFAPGDAPMLRATVKMWYGGETTYADSGGADTDKSVSELALRAAADRLDGLDKLRTADGQPLELGVSYWDVSVDRYVVQCEPMPPIQANAILKTSEEWIWLVDDDQSGVVRGRHFRGLFKSERLAQEKAYALQADILRAQAKDMADRVLQIERARDPDQER